MAHSKFFGNCIGILDLEYDVHPPGNSNAIISDDAIDNTILPSLLIINIRVLHRKVLSVLPLP